jgi:hypothetical protein
MVGVALFWTKSKEFAISSVPPVLLEPFQFLGHAKPVAQGHILEQVQPLALHVLLDHLQLGGQALAQRALLLVQLVTTCQLVALPLLIEFVRLAPPLVQLVTSYQLVALQHLIESVRLAPPLVQLVTSCLLVALQRLIEFVRLAPPLIVWLVAIDQQAALPLLIESVPPVQLEPIQTQQGLLFAHSVQLENIQQLGPLFARLVWQGRLQMH